MKQILVPLSGQYDVEDPEDLDRPALMAALAVGRRFNAHVEVFCIEADPTRTQAHLAPWVPGSTVKGVISEIELENEVRRKRARAIFDSVMGLSPPPPAGPPGEQVRFSVDFVEHIGEVRGSLSLRGRLADLIVTANNPPSRGSLPLMLTVALRETGRPVLIGPFKPMESIGRRVAVAWNGSAEASRAVGMAMEFLENADEVIVISVNEDGPAAPSGSDLGDYLRWHGIAAKAVTMEGTAHSAGRIVIEQANDFEADMLIMGAYTRDRLHRLIFGGVTGEVLAHATIPVLMVD